MPVLTDEQNDCLRQFHANLGQTALDPDNSFFVDFQRDYPDVVGDDVVQLLTRDLTWSDVGAVRFLSGFRGAGKSTQLRRLRQELDNRQFTALFFDLEDYLDLRQPITTARLTMAVITGASHALGTRLGWDADTDARSPWSRFVNFLTQTKIEGDGFGIKTGAADFRFRLKRDDVFQDRLDDFLRGRPTEVFQEANTALDSLVALAREAESGSQGVVLIVDSLDHNRSAVQFDQIRAAIRTMFDQQLRLLQFESVQTVYCIPPYLMLQADTVHRIHNIKVEDRGGHVVPQGRDALRRLVHVRVPAPFEATAIISEDQLDRMIVKSGGHIRDLLRILRVATLSAQSLPFSDSNVDKAIIQIEEEFPFLTSEERRLLGHVAKTQDIELDEEADWGVLAGLMDAHLVLRYPNERTWYGVHPLVRHQLASR